jgi:hypothetical protein
MKIKLYLDTCLFGALDNEREIKTKVFFDFVAKNKNKYELVISPMVIVELEDITDENKQNHILEKIEKLNLIKLPFSDEAVDLAENYIKAGILNKRHIDDLTHVAYATIYECDILISWNRKHLAKLTTMQKVNKFNLDNNRRMIIIETPQFILPKED